MRRRTFFELSLAAALGPSQLFAQRQQESDVPLVDQVPSMLDHILLGCSDLQAGIAFVEQHTGVRAAFGGFHPGRGTQNALLSLSAPAAQGPGRYLEIIAPDPQQSGATSPLLDKLKQLSEPRLVGWAAHLRNNIEAFAAKLKQDGIAVEGPTPGSRKGHDGKELRWQTLTLKDDANGLLPFFIEWSATTAHPSTDAPTGCQLLRFELLTTDPATVAKLCAPLALEAPIAKASAPQLHAVIEGSKGALSATS
jgi:catechol 2,3-dioxygenase-like lactoylglutathione lyase family enzyme